MPFTIAAYVRVGVAATAAHFGIPAARDVVQRIIARFPVLGQAIGEFFPLSFPSFDE